MNGRSELALFSSASANRELTKIVNHPGST